MDERISKMYDFAVVVVYVFAVIGSLASLLYDHHFLLAAASVAVYAMAFPYFLKHFKSLIA